MQIARKPARHAGHKAEIVSFAGEREIAAVMRAEDPFGAAGRCAFGPDGQHHAIGSCGDVVCCHCARIFWS